MNKQVLWGILEKYDGIHQFSKFTDSLSKVIQGTQSENDMVEIIKVSNDINKSDTIVLDSQLNLCNILF